MYVNLRTHMYINGFVYVFMDVWLYGNLLRVQYLCGCVCGGDGQELDLTVPCSTCMSFVIHLKIKKTLIKKKRKKKLTLEYSVMASMRANVA